MSKEQVQIDRWFCTVPDLTPDTEGNTPVVSMKSFGPLEVYEWGIDRDGTPYELYNWCENDSLTHENYCRSTAPEALIAKAEEVIRLFESKGFGKQAESCRAALAKVKERMSGR